MQKLLDRFFASFNLRIFKVDYARKGDIALQNQNTLRQAVGWLGVLLPVMVWVFLMADTGRLRELPSISHYYFTRSAGIFVIVVSLVAIFLFIYKGNKPTEFFLSVIAGIGAMVVVLFPTNNLSAIICTTVVDENGASCAAVFNDEFVVTRLKDSAFRHTLHYIGAAVFLLCLALLSIFSFTQPDHIKENAEALRRQDKRHFFYRLFGYIMIAAMAVILLGFILNKNEIRWPSYEKYNLTFWMEVVAVEAFGFSWLMKGKRLIKE